MKPDQLIFSNLDHDRGYIYKFPPEFPMSHDLGLNIFSHVGALVGTSLRHHRQICSSGNLMVHGAFNRLNKLSRAFYFWLSRPSDPKIFRWLLAIAGPGSSSCQSNMKQVSSHMQNFTRLQFGSLVREEHAIQLLLARVANAMIGRLWNDFEQQHAFNLLTLSGAAAIVPPLENISPKMLAESIALGNIDGYTSRPADQPYVEGKCLSCTSVAVPSTIFKEDAIEPKTGIKFPAFLEDDSSSSATVLVGIGFKGMRIMRVKNLNLYAFGLYMQPNSICEKLGPKYASVPTTKLMDNPDFYNDLLRENLHMRVRLVVNYNGLSIGAVRDVFEKSLGLRLQKMNPNTDYHCLKTFGSYFTKDIPIPAGTEIDFCQTSDGQLITEIDGKQIGAVRSKDLCKAFFDMYIGDSPVSLEAKKDVAQNIAGLIGRR
ncbi:fatty-acid-binding protein 2-like isoform X1 [Phragmites australis]|uniref:fatty-acid-binding protein 2-like isoform X1 n=2 Tax=Phragmites australis TaxID=29695 RepID=UPI002D798CD1|nr:fatty-acid-binding protein 2-like isoform X1 [Phragmites australis]